MGLSPDSVLKYRAGRREGTGAVQRVLNQPVSAKAGSTIYATSAKTAAALLLIRYLLSI